ncbi:MAG: sensor histidine kinase [Microbacteriaceae bacterium]
MKHSALTPVFTALRVSLHALVVGLALYVIARGVIVGAEDPARQPRSIAVIALGCGFILTYLAGAALPGTIRSALRLGWLAAITAQWLALILLTADASFIVFGLFFLYLHLLRNPWGAVTVLGSTACAIVGVAWHDGWSTGGVIGPLVGAGVAIAIGLGYQALFREAREREELIADLIQTRSQLATTEREAGVLAERARLAREIHDTVAQGLSSIQLLLHAVERADQAHPAIEYVRLARETAATNLTETRRFIRELTPPALQEQTLDGALRRLSASNSLTTGAVITVRVSGDPLELPMNLETALLRIAQASLANVGQHAEADRVDITLSYMDDAVSLDVVDNGRGFDPSALTGPEVSGHRSFGLLAMRQRVARLGGSAVIESSPGAGTAIAVSFPLPSGADPMPEATADPAVLRGPK